MKHNYITCDICGDRLIKRYRAKISYRKYRTYIGKDEITMLDICNDCMRGIITELRLKRRVGDE